MARCLVVADDLTGANATGVMLHDAGYSARTVLSIESSASGNISDCDCLLYPTDSRSISGAEAYKRVYEATQRLRTDGTKVFAKRIDSTLRGNLGQETDAMLDALGGGAVAIVAPCFPSSGRIVCGGYMLVNSVPLHKTSAAVDPKNPVHTSCVADLFKAQSKYPVASIDMNTLRQGTEHIKQKIADFASGGARIITFDCISDDDLDLIADAAIASAVPFISVGPGPSTLAAVKRTLPQQKKAAGDSILLVIGSVNAVAKAQVDEVMPSREIFASIARPSAFAAGAAEREAEIKRVTDEVCGALGDFGVCAVIGEGIDPDKRIDLKKYEAQSGMTADELSTMINGCFAKITAGVLERGRGRVKGLYTSGGDITVAVCKELCVNSIQLESEVLPLAAFGALCGGKYTGLNIITKGGMAGDKYALRDCIAYLKSLTQGR